MTRSESVLKRIGEVDGQTICSCGLEVVLVGLKFVAGGRISRHLFDFTERM